MPPDAAAEALMEQPLPNLTVAANCDKLRSRASAERLVDARIRLAGARRRVHPKRLASLQSLPLHSASAGIYRKPHHQLFPQGANCTAVGDCGARTAKSEDTGARQHGGGGNASGTRRRREAAREEPSRDCAGIDPRSSSKKDRSSAHCLRFADSWYGVYELQQPSLDQEVTVQVFGRKELDDGTWHWQEITPGRPFSHFPKLLNKMKKNLMSRLGTRDRLARDEPAGVAVRYTELGCAEEAPGFSLDANTTLLLMPQPSHGYQSAQPQAVPEDPGKDACWRRVPVAGVPAEFLVVDRELVSVDGRRCDTAGVGYRAFSKQPRRCAVPRGSCLGNQPLHMWRRDTEARLRGRRGAFFLENWGQPAEPPLVVRDGKLYLALAYPGRYPSLLRMQLRADLNSPLKFGNAARVTEVRIDATQQDATRITALVTNLGVAATRLRLRMRPCGGWYAAQSDQAPLQARQSATLELQLPGQPDRDRLRCTRLLKAILGLCWSAVAAWGQDGVSDTPPELLRYRERELSHLQVVHDAEGFPIHPHTCRRTVRIHSKNGKCTTKYTKTTTKTHQHGKGNRKRVSQHERRPNTCNKIINKNLNVIIGPNGSGKSTIVSAIILGLGGKLKLADRGSSLASYIKTGCKEAKIEIELRTGTTSTTVISRVFNLDNKCVWRIDGKVVSSKQVDDKVAEYNIQIGNLCQFLPQEKVTDFAKMNRQVLLENTEKSVGGEKKLAQMHEQLKCLTKEIKEYEKKINEYQAAVENDEQTNSRLAVTVNNIKERMACIEAVKLLKKKRVWAVYKAHKVHTEQKQKEMAEAVADLQRCKKEFEPFESLLDGANKRLQTAQSKLNTCKIRTRDKINTLKNESVSREPVSERIEYVNQEYKKKIEAEKSRESELAALQLQLNKMQNDLRELSKQSDDSTHTQLKEVQEQISKVSDACNIFRHKCEDYKSKVSYIDHEIRAQDSELQRLRNVANQRLSLLQHRHPDVYRGTMWLRENKHRFSGNVYDPIVLETNLKDPSYAKYVEAVISNRDLLAFTFEDKDDMNNAMRILRDEMNLRLNFLHSGEMHQPSSYYKSTIPIKHLREFGFKTYISDVIEAPEAILKYLLRTYGLHNIPVGTKQTDATFEKVPASIRLFFSESSRYSASHSIYSGEKLTENSRVTEANYFTRSISIKEIQVIGERKEKLLQEKQQISHDHHTVVQQLMHQESKLKELVNKRKQIQEIVQNRQALGARIKIKQNHINSLEKNKINIKEEEEKFNNTVKKIILDAFNSESKSHETLKEYVELMNKLRLLQYETEDTAAEVERYQHDAQEIKQKCLELENTVRKLKGELSELQTQQKQLLGDAEKAIADVKDNKDTFRNVQQTVQDLDKKKKPREFLLNVVLFVAWPAAYCWRTCCRGPPDDACECATWAHTITIGEAARRGVLARADQEVRPSVHTHTNRPLKTMLAAADSKPVVGSE
ncbi:structural maintenance of chromosomes protein 5-like [Schistocerca nitens]|uniref:structural maintenance of chromosomes protein 5-like n=1 Tax=Schistocerca nitens TaxID=7011 RepID=UPI002117FC87|nr:structural maintenance of chromosomes protein 5-like [Schistocerca nitens]